MISFANILSLASTAAALSQAELHPLATAPHDVEVVTHEDGSGFSMRLHPQISEHQPGHQMSYLKRKRMHKAQRESWPTQLAQWFGLMGQIEETVSLTNVDNLVYHGSLTMGSASEAVAVVFDTGSLGLAVQGTGCTTNCASTTYTETGSSDYSATATPASMTFRTSQAENYWINASGVEAEDSITVDSQAINPFKFYMLSSLS